MSTNTVITWCIGGVLLCSSIAGLAADLVQIHEQATLHDPVFRAAAASKQTAIEALPQNRALLLPTLTLDASKSDITQKVLSGSAFLFASESQGYTLTLRQPLFHRDYFVRLAQANTVVAQAEIEYLAAEQALIVRTAQQYFDTLAAQDDLGFAHAEKNALERQLEQTKQRFEVGLIAITDVHEAQAAYDLVSAQTIEAENRLSSQYEALHELTNQYHDKLAKLDAETPLINPEPAGIEQWSQQALRENLVLQAAQLNAQTVKNDIKIYQAGHLPQLDLQASHAYNDSSGGNFGTRETEDRTVTLQFTLPLYQGGAVNSQIRAAQGRYQQATAAVEQQRRATLRQARDGYRGVLAAIKRVKALQQAVISAQSALTATEAGLEVGTRTTVDVLGVRRNLFRAQRDHARARYDYILNTLRLKHVSGQLQHSDLQQVNRWLH